MMIYLTFVFSFILGAVFSGNNQGWLRAPSNSYSCPHFNYSKIHFSSISTKHFHREHVSPQNNGTIWCAASNQSGLFLQLYFQNLTYVCSLITRPSSRGSLVTSYNLSSSTDGVVWQDYTSTIEVNHSNNGQTYLPRPLAARYLRIYPVSWTHWPCLQFSLTAQHVEIVKLQVVSEGWSDPGAYNRKPLCSIKVNNIEQCPGQMGHNVVVLEPSTGNVYSTAYFDTANNQTAARRLATYLTKLEDRTIIVIAVAGSGHRNISTSARDQLYFIGASDPLVACENCSWILVGRRWLGKPWITQTYRSFNQGPAHVTLDIPLEENNDPTHFWRLDQINNKKVMDEKSQLDLRPKGGHFLYHDKFDGKKNVYGLSDMIDSSSCLVNPDKCQGGISMGFWTSPHQTYLPSKMPNNPQFKVQENKKAKCYHSWLTRNNKCCIFPFKFKQQVYTTCTGDESEPALWCAVSPTFDQDGEKDYCAGCNRPLVMNNFMFVASSRRSDTHFSNHALFWSKSCWSPSTKDVRPYLQITLLEIMYITAIATKGCDIENESHWVMSYRLWYSFGLKWRLYFENLLEKDFVVDSGAETRHVLKEVLKVRLVRLYPQVHTGKIALKVQLYGCNEDEHQFERLNPPPPPPKGCGGPLGLAEGGNAKHLQFFCSSFLNGYHAVKGRLCGPLFWRPRRDDGHQFFMIAFDDRMYITALATQGGQDSGEQRYVTSFYLTMSIDRLQWEEYFEDEELKIFQGNRDANSTVRNNLKHPMTSRYMRIHPNTWSNGGIALRAEVYGCYQDNPKFSIVGPVYHNAEGGKYPGRRNQLVTVAYRICLSTLPCPTCKRLVYVRVDRLTISCVTPNPAMDCQFVEYNASSNHVMSDIWGFRHTISVEVYDAFAPDCILSKPFSPVPINPTVVGYFTTFVGRSSCLAHLYKGNVRNGIYSLHVVSGRRKVYCDQTTMGGGWMVIQKRFNGSVNFNRDWNSYLYGFGSLDGEHWIGLKTIKEFEYKHSPKDELLVEVEDYDGKIGFAHYRVFRVLQLSGYALQVSNYSGNIGDSLALHNMAAFSTRNKDTASQCSNRTSNGWWNNDSIPACHTANLNGRYDSMTWNTFNQGRPLKASRMMIRQAKRIKCSHWACYYIQGYEYHRKSPDVCQRYGARMLSITSADEESFVKTFVKEHTDAHANVLLGLKFDGNTKSISWIDNSPKIYKQSTINGLNTSQGCFVMKRQGSDYVWDQYPCIHKKALLICKRGKTCYRHECFGDFTSQKKTCSENKQLCENNNLRMTRILDRKKDSFVLKHIKDNVRTGLEVNSGKFKWSGLDDVSYTNWKRNDSTSENCVSQTKEGWISENPIIQRPSLCEHDINPRIDHCNDLLNYGVTQSGVYPINGKTVYCDMENDGGGWEVIMRRSNQDFTFETQTWNHYKEGFGSRISSFWQGNDGIAGLTNPDHRKSLLINFVLANNTKYYAFYDSIVVHNYREDYKLTVKGYAGNAGDSLSYHNGAKFSTLDKDHDHNSTHNCASLLGGGWWFKNCLASNLNGMYSLTDNDNMHIHWETLNAPIKYVEMKTKTLNSVSYPSLPILRTMDTDDHKGFTIQYYGVSYLATVRTSTKKWQLMFNLPSNIWSHVLITWSEATGILYYRDGMLKASNPNFEEVENAIPGTKVRLAGPPGDGRISSSMFRLAIWTRQIENDAVEHAYRFNNYTFEIGRTKWKNLNYDKNAKNHHFNWTRQSGCTPSKGTGPCTDHTFKNPRGWYLYAEASSPRVKDNYTITASPMIPAVYRCIRFWYHMKGTGKATLTFINGKTETWQMVQNNRQDWQHGQTSRLTFQPFNQIVYFHSTINQNFESDIAIDDISYDVRPCTNSSLHSLNDVLVYQSLGCYKDPGNSNMVHLEYMPPLSYDPTKYENRTKAIQKCAQAAKARGYVVFGLKNGLCRSGYKSHLYYDRAGTSTDCSSDGRGSATSMHVYKFDVCDPKCPRGIKCNVKTLKCDCGDMKFVGEDCRSTLYKTTFVDASHYWSFDDSSTVIDLVRYKTAVIQGNIKTVDKGPSNGAVQLNGSSNSIILGDFKGECLGDFDLCANGFTISVWIKHYWDIKVNAKHVFLSLGSTSGLEKGFQFGYDPKVHIPGEKPYISLHLTFTSKLCKFKLPIVGREVWSQYGFSFKNPSVLTVYHNGKTINVADTCKAASTNQPKTYQLRVGLTTQNSVFEIDDLVVWDKWLNETDYFKRYQYVGGGGQQRINVIFKLNHAIWHQSLKDMESRNTSLLKKSIIESFKLIFRDHSTVTINVNGFSEGSVKVNVTLLFGTVTYNESLLLEKWLNEKKMLNNMSISVLDMTSSTVPQLYPNVTCIPYNLSTVQLTWGMDEGLYELFQGYRIIFRKTKEPESVFQVYTEYGRTNTTYISNLEPGVNYTMRMLILSLAGDGFISPVFYGLTKDELPMEIPTITSFVNTSSTSLLLNWTHIQNWRGFPLGYRIVYWPPDIPTDQVQNTTVLPNFAFVELTTLRKFANYCMIVAAYNRAGDGNYTEPVCLETEEDVPDAPPANVTVANLTNTILKITSTGVPILNWNGVILKYTVNWTSYDGARKGIVNCVSSPLITCYLKELKPYTWYNLSITSFTRVGPGNYSVLYTVLTMESVPSVPPPNLIGHNKSSTAIFLSWSTIPKQFHHGRFEGFVVIYSIKDTSDLNHLWLCESTTSINITLLQRYREYNISVAGFTGGGVGKLSNVFVWTDEDIPFSSPSVFNGNNLTSTSLRLHWQAVPYEYANGIILGYTILMVRSHVIYKDILNASSYNVTILGGHKMHHDFTLLEMFTDYTYKILAFTKKGNGNFSEEITIRTDEDAPFLQPSNFSVESLIWHTSQVNWTLVPRVMIPGICRGYVIEYIRKEGTPDIVQNVTVSAITFSTLLLNLAGYILYDFWIYAFTYPHLIGPRANVTLRTKDWLPMIPPPMFTAIVVSSTMIKVNWQKVPAELTNGVMVGYVLEYTNRNKSKSINATYPTETTSSFLTDLWKFNYFTLRIISRNVNGFCRYWSKNVTVQTFEDTPDKSPENSTGQSVSPTSILIKWKPVPLDYQNGFITAHSVFYRLKSISEERILGDPTIRKDVGPTTYELLIDNLQSFAEYDVKVLAQTVKGDGVKAAAFTAATCRCFERLVTNWRPKPPYVNRNKHEDKPQGMIPAIVERAVLECCKDCPAFGKVKINFNIDGYNQTAEKAKDMDVKSTLDDETDINFPIFGYVDQTHYARYYSYIPVVPTSGVAFIVNKHQSAASPNNVAMAVISCWPLLMLNIMIAFLVGFIVWLLDSKQNPEHFHDSFIRGVASGFWFAFTTLTTVGYGDKTVVTFPARVFTVFWTLFGLVVFGILMGSFSAALETMVYAETKSDIMTALYGTKIAAIDNSSEHRLGLRRNAKVNSANHYTTLEEVRDAMLDGEVKGALVDAYVAAYYKDLFNHDFLRLQNVYKLPSAYGAVLGGPTKKISKCMAQFMSENRIWISRHIAENSPKLTRSKAPMVEVAEDMVDDTSNIFLQSRESLMMIFVTIFVAGLFYEAFRQFRKHSKTKDPKKCQKKIKIHELRKTLNKMILVLKNRIHNKKKHLEKLVEKM